MTIDQIKALIRDVPDFPRPGIVFKDITPLLADAAGFRATIDHLAGGARELAPDAILAIESRGFIFGAALARQAGLPLHMVRKRGKLPRAAVSIQYELEYGHDHLEIHADAIEQGCRYLIVDDVIATGGTAAAVAKLVRRQQGVLAGCAVVIELAFLDGRARLEDCPLVSLIRY
jgi:adenine phosphoribosyltransferase